MGRVVLVTGVARHLGGRLARMLQDDPAVDRVIGVDAVPHDSGIKHLYLCGRQNLPGLGFEGEIASAWGCARLIAAGETRKDLLKREVLLSRG